MVPELGLLFRQMSKMDVKECLEIALTSIGSKSAGCLLPSHDFQGGLCKYLAQFHVNEKVSWQFCLSDRKRG